VTTALRRLTGSGKLIRRDDGTWLLRGEPPHLLEELRGRS
jgi:hypothetical protein